MKASSPTAMRADLPGFASEHRTRTNAAVCRNDHQRRVPANSPLLTTPGTLNGQTVNFNHIPAFNYFDFATRFNVNEHFDLTFTVMNLLDKKPPIVGNTAGTTSQNSGNTFPATYDPLGRRFAAGARIKF